MIKKKKTQTLLLVFNTFLLFVSVTVSAQSQPAGQPSNFTGVWNIITNKGEKLVITLRHDRSDLSVVVGSYHLLGDVRDKPLDGGLKGTVTDNVLRFTWSQDESRRAGRFTLSSDGESLEGTYSATRNPDDASGGSWNGTRQHSFAGAWQGKFGGGALELILQQAGQSVTGRLRVNSAELGEIRGGRVDGNTLRFNLVRPGRPVGNGANLPDEYVGIGELVLDKSGKSFNGKVLGAVTSGTRVGR
jgi:hypothetical protein